MIELKLIPTTGSTVPAIATSQSALADALEGQGSGGLDWSEVERVVPGTKDYVALRVPRDPGEVDQAALDALGEAVTSSIGGLTEHPDGWTEVVEDTAGG